MTLTYATSVERVTTLSHNAQREAASKDTRSQAASFASRLVMFDYQLLRDCLLNPKNPNNTLNLPSGSAIRGGVEEEPRDKGCEFDFEEED